MNRRANRGRMGKSQKSAKPYGRATPNWIPQSGIHFSPSLSQAKDHPSINVRKILDTTHCMSVRTFRKMNNNFRHTNFAHTNSNFIFIISKQIEGHKQ